LTVDQMIKKFSTFYGTQRRVHRRVHKSPPFDPTLSEMNLTNTLTSWVKCHENYSQGVQRFNLCLHVQETWGTDPRTFRTILRISDFTRNSLHGAKDFFEKLIIAQVVKKSIPFIEPKSSLPCSQETITGLYPQSVESTPTPISSFSLPTRSVENYATEHVSVTVTLYTYIWSVSVSNFGHITCYTVWDGSPFFQSI